jgi:hypothetical protein
MWIRYSPDTDILTIRLDPGETQFRNELYSSESLRSCSISTATTAWLASTSSTRRLT